MPKTLSKVSTTQLQGELRRRQKQLSGLQKKRQRLLDQLSALDADRTEAGGGVTMLGRALLPPGRKRPINDANLADSLVKVLTKKVMSVTQVADAVQQSGYNTTSPNFRTIVNQTLIKDKRFKRVGRGKYTAKAGARGRRGAEAAKAA